MLRVIEIEKFRPADIFPGESLNVIVGACSEEQIEIMFGPTEEYEQFIEVPRTMSWPQLLVTLGCYRTRALAMKSFCKMTGKEPQITPGWHEESCWTGGQNVFRFAIHLYKPQKEHEKQAPS